MSDDFFNIVFVFMELSLKMENFARNNRAYDCGKVFSGICAFLNFQSI